MNTTKTRYFGPRAIFSLYSAAKLFYYDLTKQIIKNNWDSSWFEMMNKLEIITTNEIYDKIIDRAYIFRQEIENPQNKTYIDYLIFLEKFS